LFFFKNGRFQTRSFLVFNKERSFKKKLFWSGNPRSVNIQVICFDRKNIWKKNKINCHKLRFISEFFFLRVVFCSWKFKTIGSFLKTIVYREKTKRNTIVFSIVFKKDKQYNQYNKTRHWFLCSLWRPNGWTEWADNFCGYSWVAWGRHRLKKIDFFFKIIIFFHRQRRALQLVIYILVISDCLSVFISYEPLDRFASKSPKCCKLSLKILSL